MAAAKKDKTVHTSGKRKRSIARATLKPGKGVIKVNKRPLEIITPEVAQLRLKEPLAIAGIPNIDINVNVVGGGWSSQTEAARLAIAKALVEYAKSDELKQKFLEYDRHLLVADTRRKEPRKPLCHSKARAKRQKSYR